MQAPTNPTRGRRRLNRQEDYGMEARRRVGDYLAGLRLNAGLTQLELGKVLGMRDTAISAIELGRNSFPPERLYQMADALGVDPRKLSKEIHRWYNPWSYSCEYPRELSRDALEALGLPERLKDHRKEP